MEKNNSLILREGVKISERRRVLMFININISCVASSMLQTALSTALPPIMKDFNIDAITGQWLTSGYSLFLAIIVPFTAYLITTFRTKRLYCVAIVCFNVGLIICAVAPNFWMMMIGRVIQGGGTGLITSMAQVIILTITPPEKKGMAMGWYGMSISVAPVLAPILAGLIVDHAGWRVIFILSLVIMLGSLAFALFSFEDVLPMIRKNFDVLSLLISTFAFGGITLAVGNMGKYKFVSWPVLFVLLVGLFSFPVFIYRQLHLKIPFLDVRVFKNVKVAVSIVVTALLQLLLVGSAIIFPIYVQQIKGESATVSGMVILPGSFVLAVLCLLAGKVYDKMGMNLLFVVGSILLIFSNLSLYFVEFQTSVWVISAVHVVRCFAFGILLMPLITWGMKDVPNTKASDATAFFNSFRFIGGAIGSALFVSVMTMVAGKVKGSRDHPEMYGFNTVFLVMALVSLLILVLGVCGCRKESKSKRVEDKVHEETSKSKRAEDKVHEETSNTPELQEMEVDKVSKDKNKPEVDIATVNNIPESNDLNVNISDKKELKDIDVVIHDHNKQTIEVITNN